MTDTTSFITAGVAPLGYVAWAADHEITQTPDQTMLKTRTEIRAEFTSKGWSMSGWAKKNGYSTNLVIGILTDNESNPRLKCLRGEAHNAAVQLGLKAGEVSRLHKEQFAAA